MEEKYTDKEIVEGILANDTGMIEHLFCHKCANLIAYIAFTMFDNRLDRWELINEFLLYLSADHWRKLSMFDYRSRLTTWLGVVAVRFFQKRRKSLIDSAGCSPLNIKNEAIAFPSQGEETFIDINEALRKLEPQRYAKVIRALDILDRKPEEVAEEMDISVDNLYNLHRRALKKLKSSMGKKEDYYD